MVRNTAKNSIIVGVIGTVISAGGLCLFLIGDVIYTVIAIICAILVVVSLFITISGIDDMIHPHKNRSIRELGEKNVIEEIGQYIKNSKDLNEMIYESDFMLITKRYVVFNAPAVLPTDTLMWAFPTHTTENKNG